MLVVLIKNIYSRMVGLLISPQHTWREIIGEKESALSIIKHFFLPLVCITIALQLTILFFERTWGQAILLSIISGLSVLIGTRGACLIVKEFLIEKVENPKELAALYTYNTAAVFTLFNGLSFVLAGGFLEQLFLALSFVPIFSLYVGIKNNQDIALKHKTGLWLINFITIIVLPYALRKMLCILFSISAYNI
ncbi:MAG: hypothetical protein ACRDDZ_09445 [Marinifilaceae bacterium]